MLSLRAASRVSLSTRVRSSLRQIRHESTNTSNSSSGGTSSLSQSLIGGLAGGGLVFLGGYTYYHFSGAKNLVNTAKKAENAFKSYGKQLKESSPEPNEALEWLRSTAKSYAAFIPGAKGYVDSAFDDLDAVRNKHGKEVDSIIKEAYEELKDVSQEGMSVTAATKAWDILQKHLKRIGDLAGDAASDIINNHPALKEKVGENLDQLKQMGDKYGPDAKKQVDETWDQIRDILKSGVSASTIPKIQSLVQEKVQKIQELGGKVWDQGIEKAKPYLDKSPEVKNLVEENKEKLKKQGNVQELYEKIKDAVQSGSTDSLKQYVQSTVNKVGQGSGGDHGGIEKYLSMVPGGGDIIPKLTQLQQIAQEHGEEAEKIAKDTFKEMQEVLQRKVGEAEELAQKAKKNAKRN
ncbi:MAG: hypothetical protein ALECFALPRED_000145 [Alectoria fallacina]|uniref:Uncharacterized protein n=1 Tax=Alectoria fallacina TaxID=1903189 RepID=A0A8H3HUP8_9LECA|nr:MAG: hypothetical protein ALECFALPRED_000145 [Alectoria fallacina]